MSKKWGNMYEEHKQTKGQKFGELFVIKKGKKINVRQAINEANVDCEIYDTLERHNMIQTHNKQDISEIINDIGQINLMTSLEKIKKAEEMWKNLPISIREEFKNDIHNFIDNGEKHFKNKIEQEIIKKEEEKKKAEEEKKKKEIKDESK